MVQKVENSTEWGSLGCTVFFANLTIFPKAVCTCEYSYVDVGERAGKGVHMSMDVSDCLLSEPLTIIYEIW